jgi:hypothetical protein
VYLLFDETSVSGYFIAQPVAVVLLVLLTFLLCLPGPAEETQKEGLELIEKNVETVEFVGNPLGQDGTEAVPEAKPLALPKKGKKASMPARQSFALLAEQSEDDANKPAGMVGIISLLTELHGKYHDEVLLQVVQMLRSPAANLWDKQSHEMAEMPAWLQEQNRAFMLKKEREAFYVKHLSTKEKAYEARAEVNSLWQIGDKVEIIKVGSHTGKKAVVTIPDWEGRIMVKMDGGGNIMKSYMANELKKFGSEFRTRTKSMISFTEAWFKGVDKWDFCVLTLQQALIDREQQHIREGRTPSISMRSTHVRESSAVEGMSDPALEEDAPVPQALSVLGVHLFTRHGISEKFGVDEVAITGPISLASPPYLSLSLISLSLPSSPSPSRHHRVSGENRAALQREALPQFDAWSGCNA